MRTPTMGMQGTSSGHASLSNHSRQLWGSAALLATDAVRACATTKLP